MFVPICLTLGDTCRIADPEASKPDDWDEDAPKEIVDEEAEKPEGWLDDEPEEIDDPGNIACLAARMYLTCVYVCTCASILQEVGLAEVSSYKNGGIRV